MQKSRPILIFGNGIKLAGAQKIAREFAAESGIPVCPTWGAIDVFPGCVGAFGTHGVPAANYAVQNADYILCVGARLDTKSTGYPVSSFAPHARLVMVDVDQSEIAKMKKLGRPVEGIQSDAKEFLIGPRFIWRPSIQPWKDLLESKREEPQGKPYDLVRELGKHVGRRDVIVSDTGNTLGWMMQGYPFKGERFIHAFNQTPMGYGLPAAVGAAFATGRRVVLVTGDGGLAVNITELATVAHHSLPIKVVLFNNRGHGMCRVTQRQWLGGVYPATSHDGGIACPDYSAIAKAYGLRVHYDMRSLFSDEGPGFLELQIPENEGLAYQIKFGEPLA